MPYEDEWEAARREVDRRKADPAYREQQDRLDQERQELLNRAPRQRPQESTSRDLGESLSSTSERMQERGAKLTLMGCQITAFMILLPIIVLFVIAIATLFGAGD